jgi:hypothetical protein
MIKLYTTESGWCCSYCRSIETGLTWRYTTSHMNEDVIADLKQSMVGTVRQELSGVATKDDLQAVKDEVVGLRSEMNQRFDDQDAKLETIADAHAETLADREQRLSHLEHQAA